METKKPFRRVIVLVLEERNGKPHIQVFGESIPPNSPIPLMVEAFQSQTGETPTVEINGKEWARDEDNQAS